MHHKCSVGSLSSPSSSSPSLQSSRLHLNRHLCRHRLCSRTAAGDDRPPHNPHPHPLLLRPSRSCPDLLLVGGITIPPLKICVQSSRPPSFSLLKRFIVVWGGRGRTSSMSSSPLGSFVITSPPSPPRSAASSKPLPDNRRYVACWERSWEGSVRPLAEEDSVLGGRLNRMQQKKKQNIIFLFHVEAQAGPTI